MNNFKFFTSTENKGKHPSDSFFYQIPQFASKLLWLTPMLALPSFILYITLSLTIKTIGREDAIERIPFLVIAVLLALACIYLLIRNNWIKGKSTSLLAYWSLIFMGIASEALAPSQALNNHATALSITISASAIGLLIALLRYWSLMIVVPYFLILSTDSYIRNAYNIEVDLNLVSQILGASPHDVAQFATPGNLLGASLWVLITTGIVWLMTKWATTTKRIKQGTSCCLLLLASILVSNVVLFPPISIDSGSGIGGACSCYRLHYAYKQAKDLNTSLIEKLSHLPSPSEQTSHISTLHGEEGVIIVLHVGESVRADRLGINGYKRDTTPWLKTCRNLINFKNCTASAPYTTGACLAILTNARGNMDRSISPQLEASTGCIMDLFAANGFVCYGFFSSSHYAKQHSWGALFERLQTLFTLKAKAIYELGELNASTPKKQLLQIADALNGRQENKFLLVNNCGSHLPFYAYERENPPFQPASPNAYDNSPQKNQEAAISSSNAYDSTLVYTDEYIRDLIKMVEGKPFVYIYISDHGEPLGEGGKWARYSEGFHKAKWSKVAFFIIYSPEFEELHPHFREALANLRKNSTMATAHENIFHTLLGIFGIQTPYYEAIHDLSSPNPEPYQGPSCDRNGESLDGLKWE